MAIRKSNTLQLVGKHIYLIGQYGATYVADNETKKLVEESLQKLGYRFDTDERLDVVGWNITLR